VNVHPAPYFPPAGYYPTPVAVEFSPAENAVIGKTARRARIWGIVATVIGAVSTLGVVALVVGMELVLAEMPRGFASIVPRFALAALIPSALVHLAAGPFYLRAGAALQGVVDTQGDDLRYLMAALARMRLAFQIEVVMTLLSLGLGIASALVAWGAR
jgi:hypothetical protein